MKLLIFDTETTGLPTNRSAPLNDSNAWPHVIQLSYVLYDESQGKMLRTVDEILKLPEGMRVPEDSTKIHGITTSQMLRRGVNPEYALKDLINSIHECDYLVAHNLQFDQSVLMAEAFRQGISKQLRFALHSKRSYCTMRNGKELCRLMATRSDGSTYMKYPKLEELYETLFNIKPNGTHDALADVLICMRCYMSMTGREDPISTSLQTKQLYRLYQI